MSPKQRKQARGDDDRVVADFTGVEIGGGSIKVPEGDYRFRVKEVEQRESQEGKPYLNFKLEFVDKAHRGKVLYHICSLQPQALFNLRTTLTALGMDVPQKRVAFSLHKLEGRELMATLGDDEYQGRIRSRVVDTFPMGGRTSDEGGGTEEVDEPEAESDGGGDLEELEEL